MLQAKLTAPQGTFLTKLMHQNLLWRPKLARSAFFGTFWGYTPQKPPIRGGGDPPARGTARRARGGTHCMSLKIVTAHPRPDSAGHQPRVRGVRSISSASPVCHCTTLPHAPPIYSTNRDHFHPSTPTPRNRGVPKKDDFRRPQNQPIRVPPEWRPRLLRHLVISASGLGINKNSEAKSQFKRR